MYVLGRCDKSLIMINSINNNDNNNSSNNVVQVLDNLFILYIIIFTKDFKLVYLFSAHRQIISHHQVITHMQYSNDEKGLLEVNEEFSMTYIFK